MLWDGIIPPDHFSNLHSDTFRYFEVALGFMWIKPKRKDWAIRPWHGGNSVGNLDCYRVNQNCGSYICYFYALKTQTKNICWPLVTVFQFFLESSSVQKKWFLPQYQPFWSRLECRACRDWFMPGCAALKIKINFNSSDFSGKCQEWVGTDPVSLGTSMRRGKNGFSGLSNPLVLDKSICWPGDISL